MTDLQHPHVQQALAASPTDDTQRQHAAPVDPDELRRLVAQHPGAPLGSADAI